MLRAFLILIPLALIGLASEYLWRKKHLRGEGGRKFVHILAGVWISFWPYFVGYKTIQILSAALIVFLFISRILHIFHAVYGVKRRTLGEYLYPAAILVCALLTPPEWVFTVAVLYLAVADGLAAVVGTRYKKASHHYKVFGNDKSILGTMSYFGAALICSFVVFGFLSPDPAFFFADYAAFFLVLAIAGATFENLLPYGTDNLFIPVFVVFMLR